MKFLRLFGWSLLLVLVFAVWLIPVTLGIATLMIMLADNPVFLVGLVIIWTALWTVTISKALDWGWDRILN